MKKEKWFEDQPVLTSDLTRSESTKEDAITERLLDTFNSGVLVRSQLAGESSELLIAQGPNPGLFITVNTGVAFSATGERIVIPSVTAYNVSAPTTTTDNGVGGTTLTPQSTGSQNVPVADNATNSIWFGYLETTDTSVFTLDNVTGERLFVKRDDGFKIVVTQSSINPGDPELVLIGEVTTVSGAVTSINTANTKESQTLGPTPIPGAPYQITLMVLPNLPAEADRPASIPTIPGFTYVTGTPAAGQFTVNFRTGVATFNAANSATSVTITYLAQHTRRPLCISRTDRVGAYVTLNNTPTVYEPGFAVTLDDHVNARGSGTISPSNPHGLLPTDIGALSSSIINDISSSGLILPGGNATSTTSSLHPAAVSAFVLLDNKVTIAPLVTGEQLDINGTIVLPTDIPTLSTYTFQDPITGFPLPSGTFTFYVDPVSKTIVRSTSGAPTNSYPIMSIVWNGSSLVLPFTDLRLFGTTAASNMRLETLLGLAQGLATDNRVDKVFHARLIGSVSVTGPAYAYTGLGGTILNLTINSTPASVLFPAVPANPPIDVVVATINSQVGSANFLAAETPVNSIKMLATVSLVITGGTAAPILGFPISPAPGSADSGNIKESQISGSSSSIGVEPAVVSFTYDISNNLTQFVGTLGNRTATTVISYNADGTVNSITESLL